VTESEFQAATLDLARLLKSRVAHFRPAMNARGERRTAVAGDGAGWPDLVMARDRLIAVELKSDRGRLSVAQQEWIHALGQAGVETYVRRPADWSNGVIEAALRRRAAAAA